VSWIRLYTVRVAECTGAGHVCVCVCVCVCVISLLILRGNLEGLRADGG